MGNKVTVTDGNSTKYLNSSDVTLSNLRMLFPNGCDYLELEHTPKLAEPFFPQSDGSFQVPTGSTYKVKTRFYPPSSGVVANTTPDTSIKDPHPLTSSGRSSLSSSQHNEESYHTSFSSFDISHVTMDKIEAALDGGDKEVELIPISYVDSSQFENGIEELSNLNQPNIVKVYGWTNDGPKRYLVVRRISGVSLEKFIEDQQIEWSWELVVTIAMQISSGMKYLHERNIIHGNLSSQSITMVGKHVLLSQYGNIHTWNPNNNFSLYSYPGGYVAPELESLTDPSKESDIFSFGMTLWRLTTRKLFWEEENLTPSEIHNKIISGERPKIAARYEGDKLNEIPLELARLIELSWHQSPAARPSFEKILKYLDNTKTSFTSL